MSELITRRSDTKNKTLTILRLKSCLRHSYRSALFSLPNFRKEVDLFLIYLVFRRQPERDLETGSALRLTSNKKTKEQCGQRTEIPESMYHSLAVALESQIGIINVIYTLVNPELNHRMISMHA